jgi:chromosome segregation ATPase
MAPSQSDILHEHAQQIHEIELDLGSYRARLDSLEGKHEAFQDSVRMLSLQIGEAPRPDEGVEGHGLARAIAVLSDRIEPIVEERAATNKERAERPIRIRANISTAVALLALMFTALTFVTKTASPSDVAAPPSTTDASIH